MKWMGWGWREYSELPAEYLPVLIAMMCEQAKALQPDAEAED